MVLLYEHTWRQYKELKSLQLFQKLQLVTKQLIDCAMSINQTVMGWVGGSFFDCFTEPFRYWTKIYCIGMKRCMWICYKFRFRPIIH